MYDREVDKVSLEWSVQGSRTGQDRDLTF